MCFQVISGAGHHIFADKPEVFNEYVNSACRFSDKIPDNDAGEPSQILRFFEKKIVSRFLLNIEYFLIIFRIRRIRN